MAHLGNTIINGLLRVIGGIHTDKINGAKVGNTDISNVADGSITGAIDELDSTKISKSQTAGFVKNDGSIDTNTYAKSSTSNLSFSVDNDGILNVTYNT